MDVRRPLSPSVTLPQRAVASPLIVASGSTESGSARCYRVVAVVVSADAVTIRAAAVARVTPNDRALLDRRVIQRPDHQLASVGVRFTNEKKEQQTSQRFAALFCCAADSSG